MFPDNVLHFVQIDSYQWAGERSQRTRERARSLANGLLSGLEVGSVRR